MKPHSGYELVKLAAKNGLRVANGKGDHVVVYGPSGRGYQVIPLKKELAIGTDRKICGWLRSLGIVLAVILISISLLGVL